MPGFSRPSPTSVGFERDIYPKEQEQREDFTGSYLVELRKTTNISLTAKPMAPVLVAYFSGELPLQRALSWPPQLCSLPLRLPGGKEESQEHALSLVRFPKHCKCPKLETGLAPSAARVMAAPKSTPPAKASCMS